LVGKRTRLGDFADALRALRVAADKARQGLAVQHINSAPRLGDNVVLVAPPLQRHLAEEIALFQERMLAGADVDEGLAARDNKHSVAHIPRAHHGDPGRVAPRVEQLGDLGDLALIHTGEERHAGNHAPGDDELVAARFLAEARGDDGDGESDHADAEQHHHAAKKLAERRDRHDVAVADRGEGGEAHHAAAGIEPNLSGWAARSSMYIAVEVEQEQHKDDKERGEQRPILIGEHAAERLQRGRVAHELEQAEQAKHPEDPEIQRKHKVQIPGQEREQVDQQDRP
jgi:hypothetical protein